MAIPGSERESPFSQTPQPIQLQGTPVSQQTNVVYLQPPVFNPSPNYRNYSYIAMAVSIVLTIFAQVLSIVLELDFRISQLCSNVSCCGIFGIAFVLDALFYNSRMKWEQSIGASTTNSTIGIVFDGIFLLICVLVVMGSFLNLFVT
jgi:hypothetical protein